MRQSTRVSTCSPSRRPRAVANVIRKLVIKVTVDADTSGFKDVDDAQAKTEAGSVALGNVLADVAGRLLDAGIAAAKYGAALLKDVIFGTTKAADEIAKTSKQLGIQAEGLQRLAGAATLSGSGVEDLEKGVRTLTKGLADASLKGSGPATDALKTLGLEAEDLEQLLIDGDIEGIVGLVGDAFNETGESAEKSAALLQLFGKGGAELRPLIEEGSEGVKELGDQIKNVISDEDLAQFEELADAQFLVEDAVTDLTNQVAAGLAPAVQTVIERTGELIEANETLITQDLPVFLATVGEGALSLAEDAFELIQTWRDFITEIDNMIERFEQDFPVAVDAVTGGFTVIGAIADTVGDQIDAVAQRISDVVDFILTAIAKVDSLKSTVATIKAGLGIGGDDTTTQRGGAQFLGGGENLARADQLTPDNSSESLQRIVDGNFSEADKATARASLPLAKTREVAEETERQGAEQDAGAAGRAERAKAREERASRRERTGRERARAKRRRGGGGGGRAAPAEPSLEDLIAGVGGGPGGGPSRVAGGSSLADTLLVNINNDNSITVGATTIHVDVPARIAEQGTPEDLASLIGREFDARNLQRRQIAFDLASARTNVGGG